MGTQNLIFLPLQGTYLLDDGFKDELLFDLTLELGVVGVVGVEDLDVDVVVEDAVERGVLALRLFVDVLDLGVPLLVTFNEVIFFTFCLGILSVIGSFDETLFLVLFFGVDGDDDTVTEGVFEDVFNDVFEEEARGVALVGDVEALVCCVTFLDLDESVSAMISSGCDESSEGIGGTIELEREDVAISSFEVRIDKDPC